MKKKLLSVFSYCVVLVLLLSLRGGGYGAFRSNRRQNRCTDKCRER